MTVKGQYMIRAIYPGSFDPVLNNGGKTPLFTIDERVSMLKEVTEGLSNVKILSFSGLLVDFARQTEATVVVRGLRAISDFEYELQMAQTNHKLNPNVDTMFLATSLEYSYLSSTIVKEVAFFQGDIKEFVPEQIVEQIGRAHV